ncbi:hypothetical protein HOLleu_38912 [Holothuria leucospilota]|uniref:Immunoglobulin domain-containing protein n=1 Tax=Holothuria leucospilota TaxID=206669 RepID=A0A9Q1BDY1_HOLLE|nr:hypothetical protein HOLleu_38912 [Holothuria leucospilota]
MYLCYAEAVNLWYIVIIIFLFVSVQAGGCKSVSSHFYADTLNKPALIVRESVIVTLLCPKRAHSIVFITLANSQTQGRDPITLIDSSKMIDISNKYGFIEADNNTYAFTINRISRNDEGTYTCVQVPVTRSRAITVIYGPSDSSPQCSSNYKSPVIFYDEITNYFVFNCSTERGKPPVTTKIYVNGQDVTYDLETVNETRTDEDNIFATYSLFRHFNHTLQNSEFVCNVTQQLPSPYDDYHGSCSFGPLHLLPGFSLSVSPSYVPVRDENNVTLTCASNVTGVKITWNNIPSGKYIVTNFNRSSVLTILSFKPASNGTVFVECSGSYGSRTVTVNTTVFLMVNEEGQEDENYPNGIHVTLFVVFIICISILLVSVASCILRNKRKRKERPIETLPCKNVWGEISTSGHSRGQETTINNTSNKTYTTTVRPESQDSEEVHLTNISAQIYHRTIVMDESSPSDTKYYDISSKPTILYDSSGYLIPGGSKESNKIVQPKSIYNEID